MNRRSESDGSSNAKKVTLKVVSSYGGAKMK
jgi:hypothetical protein